MYGRPGCSPIPADACDGPFWDYVFQGKPWSDAIRVPREAADACRREFEYWYPFDLRVSGKDLIQNHLTFCLYNHVALFGKDKWPRAFRCNGHLLLNAQKMSKSTGEGGGDSILRCISNDHPSIIAPKLNMPLLIPPLLNNPRQLQDARRGSDTSPTSFKYYPCHLFTPFYPQATSKRSPRPWRSSVPMPCASAWRMRVTAWMTPTSRSRWPTGPSCA